MAKYDQALGNLRDQVAAAKNILVALPSQLTPDSLAAGLALYLSLKSAQKEASIVTEGSLQVVYSNLFGLGQISSSLPKVEGGDFTITLEGVVTEDGTVPDLEKLDYFPEGRDMKLVFKILPGHSFAPSKITPSYSGGGFNLIFTVGAKNLDALGGIYTNNQQAFSRVTIINLDINQDNSQYGAVNIVDPQASSASEIVAQVIPSLGLVLDGEVSSNLLAGIYSQTNNLTQRVNPDTFNVVSVLMQQGGQLPGVQTAPQQPNMDSGQIRMAETPTPQPIQNLSAQYNAQFPPFNQVFGFPANPEPVTHEQPQQDNFTVPPIVTPSGIIAPQTQDEQIQGEIVAGGNPETTPEPDWLTPKIFQAKGGNIG